MGTPDWPDFEARLRSGGAGLIGYADLSALPHGVRAGLCFGITLGAPIDRVVLEGISDGPTDEYAAEYKRLNDLLGRLAAVGVAYLHKRGFQAQAVAATTGGAGPNAPAVALPHKTVATRAGLGWVGKSNLLITEAFGSALRLTTILTDAPVPAGTPIDAGLCGDCTACVQACPAEALTGTEWRVEVPREQIVDTAACRGMAVSLCARRLGVPQTICGICIAACPHTQRYLRG